MELMGNLCCSAAGIFYGCLPWNFTGLLVTLYSMSIDRLNPIAQPFMMLSLTVTIFTSLIRFGQVSKALISPERYLVI